MSSPSSLVNKNRNIIITNATTLVCKVNQSLINTKIAKHKLLHCKHKLLFVLSTFDTGNSFSVSHRLQKHKHNFFIISISYYIKTFLTCFQFQITFIFTFQLQKQIKNPILYVRQHQHSFWCLKNNTGRAIEFSYPRSCKRRDTLK